VWGFFFWCLRYIKRYGTISTSTFEEEQMVRQILKYVAEDGEEFDSKQAAERYEATRVQVQELTEELFSNSGLDRWEAKTTAEYLVVTYDMVRK
jgi:hypothetical protein